MVICNPPSLWYKHAFDGYPKCDTTLNNMCEAFNATILEARDKPIIGMVEWIKVYLMRREQMKNIEGRICPKIQKILEEDKKTSESFSTWAGDKKFEVSRGGSKVPRSCLSRACCPWPHARVNPFLSCFPLCISFC